MLEYADVIFLVQRIHFLLDLYLLLRRIPGFVYRSWLVLALLHALALELAILDLAHGAVFEGLGILFVLCFHLELLFLFALFLLLQLEKLPAALLEVGAVGVFGYDAEYHRQYISDKPHEHTEGVP